MGLDIVTEFPLWFAVLCLLLGILYAGALYYRERHNEFPERLKWFLALLRMLSVSAIAFLLLNPMIKKEVSTRQKPVIIIAQDNSLSLVSGRDSSYYKTKYISEIKSLAQNLSGKFEVAEYTFGEEVKQGLDIDYSEKETNFSRLFDEVNTRFSNRNVGAMIIASDGIYNRGANPVYSVAELDFPVYTVALGDTSVRKDVAITDVNYNRIAYQGNYFPVEVTVNGKKCKGVSTTVSISMKGKVLYSAKVEFETNNRFKTVVFKPEAVEKGLQHYKIEVKPVEGELYTANNVADVFIEVLEGKQKVLILAGSPHPDIAALKQAVSSNENYEVEEYLIDGFDKNIEGYNLVILHQLPSKDKPVKVLLDKIKEKKVPALYIIGHKSDFLSFNGLRTGFSITGAKIIYNDALPVYNKEFANFSLSDKTIKAVESFPPLSSPYGNYSVSPGAGILFFQRIGVVDTEHPLMLFNKSSFTKNGIVVGTGLYKWRLYDFMKNGDHNAFNEIIDKTVQYLSVKIDKSFFKVYCKNSFYENENVEFDAELYNESYEPVNEPDVTLTVTDNEGNMYPYTFTRTETAYRLNAGRMPAGTYKYSARVSRNGKVYTSDGEFMVLPLNIESTDVIADHGLLFRLANEKGGAMVYPDRLDKLESMITARDDIKTVEYTHLKYTELLNVPLLLVVILLLLSLEWFLRKREGGY